MKESAPNHFDGRRYFNCYPKKPDERKAKQIIRWFTSRKPAKWPQHVPVQVHPKPDAVTKDGEVQVIYINHATVLIMTKQGNILTDPIWSERCSPLKRIGPKRVAQPGLKFEDLPPIDLVLVTHNHYDHLDLPTLKRLEKEHSPRFVTGLGNRKLLINSGMQNVQELDWWEELHIGALGKLSYVPSQHFSSRRVGDLCRTLWGGFVLQIDKLAPIYFAGDTGYGTFFNPIFKKFGPIGLAMLPIGAYEPRWFMKPVHMNPEEAVKGLLELQARHAIGIHFGTFQLSDEAIDDPVKDLKKALVEHKVDPKQFEALHNGESRTWLLK